MTGISIDPMLLKFIKIDCNLNYLAVNKTKKAFIYSVIYLDLLFLEYMLN